MKTGTKAVVAVAVAFAAASALANHPGQSATTPAPVPPRHVDPTTSADASARSVSTHRTPPAPVATQPVSPDWGAVTLHMAHATPGADLPIPWADGKRHTATCSNGTVAEWVEGTNTAAEMCEPYHVIEQR